jgi:hypothetical protein
MSEEVISGITEWRQQHPKATFREIEEEVDKRLWWTHITGHFFCHP